MQSKHTLEVQRRERTGSRYAKREREAGRLPAVLYGHGIAPVSLSLHWKDATKLFESGERIFTIEVKGEGITQMVFLKDLQFDYLGTNIVHVDLTRVDMEEEIESNVPLRLVGEAPGAKAHGAVVVTPVMSLTIRCKVADLPDHIDVDISGVNVGDAVHAGAVPLAPGLVLAGDVDDILYSVEVHVVEEEPTAEGAAVEAESAEPEVITERKKDEKDED